MILIVLVLTLTAVIAARLQVFACEQAILPMSLFDSFRLRSPNGANSGGNGAGMAQVDEGPEWRKNGAKASRVVYYYLRHSPSGRGGNGANAMGNGAEWRKGGNGANGRMAHRMAQMAQTFGMRGMLSQAGRSVKERQGEC
jgi:hypothetical protein